MTVNNFKPENIGDTYYPVIDGELWNIKYELVGFTVNFMPVLRSGDTCFVIDEKFKLMSFSNARQ